MIAETWYRTMAREEAAEVDRVLAKAIYLAFPLSRTSTAEITIWKPEGDPATQLEVDTMCEVLRITRTALGDQEETPE